MICNYCGDPNLTKYYPDSIDIIIHICGEYQHTFKTYPKITTKHEIIKYYKYKFRRSGRWYTKRCAIFKEIKCPIESAKTG